VLIQQHHYMILMFLLWCATSTMGPSVFLQNTNSHQYVIHSDIIFEHVSNYKWPYASLQQDKANSSHYIQFQTFSSVKLQSTWFVLGDTLQDKVYNNNHHNEDDMIGSIKNVLSSLSAKELQCVKNIFARCVHLHAVHNSKNLILTFRHQNFLLNFSTPCI
jgi:hypothetical protein